MFYKLDECKRIQDFVLWSFIQYYYFLINKDQSTFLDIGESGECTRDYSCAFTMHLFFVILFVWIISIVLS